MTLYKSRSNWDLVPRNHSSNLPEHFFQIALYLAKRDFVDHVDSVEVVGVFCNPHNTLIRTFDYFQSNPISFFQHYLAEGVVKVDPSGLEGRKGMGWKFLQPGRTKSCGTTKSIQRFLSRFGSVCLPRLCLPLRKRWLGRHGPVLQERHLDPACPGVPPHRRAPQVRDGGLPHEESRRAGTGLLLPGAASIASSHPVFPLWFPLSALSNVVCFPSVPQMPTDLPCSVSLQPGPNDSGKVPTHPHVPIHRILQVSAETLQTNPLLLQACGVDFEIKAYLANVALNPDEVIDKKCVPACLKYAFKVKLMDCV